ncbi:proton-conducting transporter membrane subunit [Salmonella sp. s51228]
MFLLSIIVGLSRMIVGGLLGVNQLNIRKIIGYSSIAQLG